MRPAIASERPHLTSGDLARLLHVDLKTIHNWVNQGHIFGRRTKGRHLRFDRTELVRFMRRFGYAIPPPLGKQVPQVLVHAPSKGGKAVAVSLRNVKHETRTGLFDVVLELTRGCYEVIVLDIDSTHRALRELVEALRSRADTRGLALVGTSRSVTRRRRFVVAWGGDAAVAPAGPGLMAAIRWLTGAKNVVCDDVLLAPPQTGAEGAY
jgi:excisionase family DNA binding protein